MKIRFTWNDIFFTKHIMKEGIYTKNDVINHIFKYLLISYRIYFPNIIKYYKEKMPNCNYICDGEYVGTEKYVTSKEYKEKYKH